MAGEGVAADREEAGGGAAENDAGQGAAETGAVEASSTGPIRPMAIRKGAATRSALPEAEARAAPPKRGLNNQARRATCWALPAAMRRWRCRRSSRRRR